MEITLEAIEKVMEATGVEYKTAKEALQRQTEMLMRLSN